MSNTDRHYDREYSPLCEELMSRVDNLQGAFDRGSTVAIATQLDDLHQFLTDAIDAAAENARARILERFEESA